MLFPSYWDDSGLIDWDGVVAACGIDVRSDLLKVGDLVVVDVDRPGWLSAGGVLVASAKMKLWWLYAQLLLRISMALEISFKGKKHPTNPLDADRVNLGGQKWLGPVQDALAMGQGPSGTGLPSVNPEAQVATLMKFNRISTIQGEKRKLVSLSVGARLGTITSKYMCVSNESFPTSKHFAAAVDASRLGGKDLMVGVVYGLVESIVRVAWAPPMVAKYNKMQNKNH